MAQKLIIDTGVKEYDINSNGLLRFNPSDPNVYDRFIHAIGAVEALEKDYAAVATEDGGMDEHGFPIAGKEVLSSAAAIDHKVKKILSEVFGPQNDFDQLMGGVNLMAVATNGERVITNLFAALEPIITAGVQEHLKDKAGTAVAQANANRAARRAAAKGK